MSLRFMEKRVILYIKLYISRDNLTDMSCLKIGPSVSGTKYSIHFPHGLSTCDRRKGDGFSSPHTCDLTGVTLLLIVHGIFGEGS